MKVKNRYDVIIIGGGITGLFAAYEFVKRGKSVVVFEETAQLGGLIRPFKVNNFWLEGFYHHLFMRDDLILNLVKELELEVSWHIVKLGFCFSPKENYAFSTLFDFLYFPKLSLSEKVKLGLFLTKVYLSDDVDFMVNRKAKDWLISCVGEKIYTMFFEPMLRAKFGMYKDEIGADWLLGRLKVRSGYTWRGEKLGYIKGGFGCLIERLAERITLGRGQIYLNSEAAGIITESGRAEGISLGDGREFYSSNIISTVPPKNLLRLADWPKDYCEKIKKLEYQGTISVVLAIEKKLTEYYWINMMEKNLKFNALIEHTNFQIIENYGAHIIYLASYPDKNSFIWDLNDEEIVKQYVESLKISFVSFHEKWIKWAKVFRSNAAGLIYRADISRNLPDIQTPIPGLFIGGMFNAYPDRSINICARIALECVNRLSFTKNP